MIMSKILPAVLLYGLLGFLLGVAGVGVVEKPLEFLSILITVMVIDVLSYRNALR